MTRLTVWLPLIRTGTGAEVWTRRLVSGLAARGHCVVLSETAHGFQYAPWLAPMRMPRGTDVIVANSWNAAAFARPGVPLVTVFHHVVHGGAGGGGTPAWHPRALFHSHFVMPMERAALARSKRAVSVSETTRADVARWIGPGPVTAVLNGVDTGFFTPGACAAVPSGPLRLLFVGTPSRRKGFHLLGPIMETLGGTAVLSCVGLKEPKGLPTAGVHMLGRLSRTDLRAAYQASDLLLFPSRLEGFGLVAAEAMACGLPVICGEGTAVAEIVPTPACGLACPAGDVAAFAAAIRGLAADPARLAAMRAAARAHAVAHLDEARWIAEMEAVLYDAANAARARRQAR